MLDYGVLSPRMAPDSILPNGRTCWPTGRACWCSVAGVLFAAALAFGHHSTASYDLVHGTIISGVVTKFQWENPHVHLSVDVMGEDDVLEHWSIELESPSTLHHYG